MADNVVDYYLIDVRARAEIDGGEVPISYFEITYSMNEIPQAVVHIPLGRKVFPEIGDVIEAEAIMDKIKPFQQMKVFAEFTSADGRCAPPGKSPGFPDGKEFLVFDGFVSEPSHTKNMQSANASLVIKGFGAAGGLAGTTQFVVGTTLRTAPNGDCLVVSSLGSGDAASAEIYSTIMKTTGNGAAQNLWDAIKNVFDHITQDEQEWASTENNSATAAIARLDTGSTQTLSIITSADISDLLNRSVAKNLADLIYNTWADRESASGDLWDALTVICSAYCLSFIPRIEDDGVLPVVLACGGDPWRVVDPSEYNMLRINSSMDKKFYSYITQVALVCEAFLPGSPWSSTASSARAIGKFPAGDDAGLDFGGDTIGRLLFASAPSWLIISGAKGKDTIKPGMPEASDPTGQAGANAEDHGAKENRFLESETGDNVAEFIMYNNLFAHRGLTFNGRFRVDICPGSMIQINTVGELFSGSSATLYGTVISVVLRAGNQGTGGFADTMFVLNSVHSKEEHDGNFTTPDHPVYGTTWHGDTLSDEVE